MNSYIVFDIETTGINPQTDKITEIGAIKIINGELVGEYRQLINPLIDIPKDITELTGIDNELVKDSPTIEQALPEFIAFAEDDLSLIGHNIMFDYSFIKYNAIQIGYGFERYGIDTLAISRQAFKELESRSLSFLCEYLKIYHENAHRALEDVVATYSLYKYLKEKFYSSYCNMFTPKPLHWKPKKECAITAKQIKFLQSLINQYQITFNKEITTLSKSEASREIDKIISNYGRRVINE